MDLSEFSSDKRGTRLKQLYAGCGSREQLISAFAHVTIGVAYDICDCMRLRYRIGLIPLKVLRRVSSKWHARYTSPRNRALCASIAIIINAIRRPLASHSEVGGQLAETILARCCDEVVLLLADALRLNGAEYQQLAECLNDCLVGARKGDEVSQTPETNRLDFLVEKTNVQIGALGPSRIGTLLRILMDPWLAVHVHYFARRFAELEHFESSADTR